MKSDCPIGLTCQQMAYNGSRCLNHSTCQGLAPEEECESHGLDGSNPNIFRTCYRVPNKAWNVTTIDNDFGWFWQVGVEVPWIQSLADGYAKPVPANLPLQPLKGGGWEVCANRDLIVIQDGEEVNVGTFATAEWNKNFRFEVNGDPIVLIEWYDGEIRQIRTEETDYMATQTKDGTILLEPDDYPIEFDYWLAPGHPEPELYGEAHKRVDLPTGIELETLLEQISNCQFVDRVLWCQVCQDSTYEEDFGRSECGHLRYINELSDWGGCGDSECDFSEEYAESFQLLTDRLKTDPYCSSETPELLVKLLKGRKAGDLSYIAEHYWSDDKLEPALKYLHSLDSDVPQEYFDRAIGWLNTPVPCP